MIAAPIDSGNPHIPAEMNRRRLVVTLDRAGIANRDVIGVENIMWRSDYPHNYGPFPNSRAQIEKELGGLSDEERHLILVGNAVRVFGLG